MHSVAMQTSDFDKAFHFYSEILGLRVVREPFLFNGKRTLTWLDAGTCYLELYSIKIDEEAVEWTDKNLGPVNLAFEVEDIDSSITWFMHNKVPILREPFIPPSGDPNQPRVAFIEGPDKEEILIRELRIK